MCSSWIDIWILWYHSFYDNDCVIIIDMKICDWICAQSGLLSVPKIVFGSLSCIYIYIYICYQVNERRNQSKHAQTHCPLIPDNAIASLNLNEMHSILSNSTRHKNNQLSSDLWRTVCQCEVSEGSWFCVQQWQRVVVHLALQHQVCLEEM